MSNMHPQHKYLMPSHQKIIRLIYSKDRCDFNSQKIYKNRKAFNRAMRFLVRNNILHVETEKMSNRFQNVYSLTLDGEFLWENILGRLE